VKTFKNMKQKAQEQVLRRRGKTWRRQVEDRLLLNWTRIHWNRRWTWILSQLDAAKKQKKTSSTPRIETTQMHKLELLELSRLILTDWQWSCHGNFQTIWWHQRHTAACSSSTVGQQTNSFKSHADTSDTPWNSWLTQIECVSYSQLYRCCT
jgi:hypothetical protein